MNRQLQRLALPEDRALPTRLTTALSSQQHPPITMERAETTVLAFTSQTWARMLRSRVIEALEAARPDQLAASHDAVEGVRPAKAGGAR
jgi:hypothetical protein